MVASERGVSGTRSSGSISSCKSSPLYSLVPWRHTLLVCTLFNVVLSSERNRGTNNIAQGDVDTKRTSTEGDITSTPVRCLFHLPLYRELTAQLDMLVQSSHSSSAVRLAVLAPLPGPESSSSPSPSSSHSSGPSPPRSTPPTPTRSRHRPLANARRPRASTIGVTYSPSFASSSSSATPIALARRPITTDSDPGSPPPYTPEPPALDPNSPFLAKRAVSSPHLHSPPQSPSALLVYPHSHTSSRRQSSCALHTHNHAHGHGRRRTAFSHADTDEDDGEEASESTASADEAVTYVSSAPSLADTLRERLFGKGKGRTGLRPITTAPGVLGAGETETESEDSVSVLLGYVLCVMGASFSLPQVAPFAPVNAIRRAALVCVKTDTKDFRDRHGRLTLSFVDVNRHTRLLRP